MERKADMRIRVTNIQRFSLQDGPGIRTTVFLKGCALRCPWCSNPENIEYGIQKYVKDGTEGVYGADFEPEALFTELMKDHRFWDRGGGVTFSGGEALLQMRSLKPLLEMLKEREIHLAVETSLFVPRERVETALPYFDFFYVDVKLLEAGKCLEVLGGDLGQYFENVELLCRAKKGMAFRVPCSMRYNMDGSSRRLMEQFFVTHKDVPVEIFRLHRLAEAKYRSLGKVPGEYDVMPERELEEWNRTLRALGIDSRVISI